MGGLQLGGVYPEKGEFAARRRVPNADGKVPGARGKLLAVRAPGDPPEGAGVAAEDGPRLLRGHVVQVNVVVVLAADRGLAAGRTEGDLGNTPARDGPDEADAVE